MEFSIYKRNVPLSCAALVVLMGSTVYSRTRPARQIQAGERTRVKGTILSRDGDLVTVRDKKSGDVVRINLLDDTKIERKKGRWNFSRDPRMDVTAMVPGLTIEAEGVGNANGGLDASRISFSPDEFVIAIAEEQQIITNQAATQRAQFTASVAKTSAEQARSSADQAQDLANQAGAEAQSAAVLGALDAAAVQIINHRVSELDDYVTLATASIYFANGQTVLDDTDRKALDHLADLAASLDGYMVEIAGHASSSGTGELNQKLSQERAAAVAQYLREKSVPVRRILAPAGYGAAPGGNNASDRRVDVRVLVNKAVGGPAR